MNEALRRSRASVLAALIRDTFQEARARWLFWGLFGLSTLLIAIFLFVLRIDIVQGAISIMGIAPTTHQVDIRKFVNISYAVVSIVLYTWGTFLAVFASSGLIPSVLEAGRISLLLSKPLTRTMLLAGRYAGNVLVIAANHIYLICSIWIIIGVKTHIWELRFLLAIPLSIFIFAVLLCVVVLIGVVFESAALSVMISVALMLISAILAQRQFMMKLLDSEWSRQLWMACYWIVPKVYDLGAALRQIILHEHQTDWVTPLWTSALFGMVVLSGAMYLFQRRDF
ncbi:MAG: ABC transporter permease [Acidobacteriaceae bacterium]|nr:ABC transporter permease [Acidobacteriaceae bacterium]MBV9295729.1 ABC transporter permease [Acidobacteriaceae bacterium]MBV9766876.1 ABC transporter permease [Acidobacteriaceae bacterium]